MPLFFSELIADNFVIPKFVVFFSIVLLVSASALFFKTFEKVNINRVLLYIFIFCFLIYFTSQFFYASASYRVINFEFLSLFVILIVSCLLASKSPKFINLMGRFNLVSFIIIVTTITINLVLKKADALDLFFGNRNHLAEYLGASILLQIFIFFKKREASNYYNAFLWYAVILGIFICVQTLCRSVLLSLFICIVIFSAQAFFEYRLKMKKRYFLFIFFLISVASIYGFKTYLSSTSEIAFIKRATTNLRLIRWENTLEMIKAHPFGVGPGNYEFAYIEFKDKKANDFELTEKVLIKSPHNGYLELFSEYGAVFGVIFLVLILYLLLEFWKISLGLYFYLLLFFCVNAIFSFPMELPFSSYFIAIFVGSGISEMKKKRSDFRIDFAPIFKYLFLPVLFGYFTIVPSLINSALVENKFESAFFCKLTPSIWRNCVDAGVQKISEGNFNDASNVLSEYLYLYPNNFIALRYYAFSLAKIGKTDEACSALKRYNNLFLGNSSVKDILLKQCSN